MTKRDETAGEKKDDKDAARTPTNRRPWKSGTHATSTSCRGRKSTRETIASATRWRRGTSTAGASSRSATELTERVTPLRHQRLAYAANWTPYAMERTHRPAVRRRLSRRHRYGYAHEDQGRPSTISTCRQAPAAATCSSCRPISSGRSTRPRAPPSTSRRPSPTSFINRESDATVKQKPAFGVAGWTKDDEAVILYDKFDVWQVAANGAGATRLTDGATEQIRHRYVRLDPDEEWIDPSAAASISACSASGRSGPATRGSIPVRRPPRPLVLEDKSVAGLAKAKDAAVFAYTVQTSTIRLT